MPARVAEDHDVADQGIGFGERAHGLVRRAGLRQKPAKLVHNDLARGAGRPGARAVNDHREPLSAHAADDTHQAGPGHRRERDLSVLADEEHCFLLVVEIVDVEVEGAGEDRRSFGGRAREREGRAADQRRSLVGERDVVEGVQIDEPLERVEAIAKRIGAESGSGPGELTASRIGHRCCEVSIRELADVEQERAGGAARYLLLEEAPDDPFGLDHLVVKEGSVGGADLLRRPSETDLQDLADRAHRGATRAPDPGRSGGVKRRHLHHRSGNSRGDANPQMQGQGRQRQRQSEPEQTAPSHRRALDWSRVVASVATTRYTMRAGSRTEWKWVTRVSSGG